MRIDFYHPDDPDTVVAVVEWDGTQAHLVRADGQATGAAVTRIFRAVPVTSDDPSLRTNAGQGASTIEPGTLQWFRAAALVRAPKVGLTPRFVADAPSGSGFDPASNYRSFRDQVARISATD